MLTKPNARFGFGDFFSGIVDIATAPAKAVISTASNVVQGAGDIAHGHIGPGLAGIATAAPRGALDGFAQQGGGYQKIPGIGKAVNGVTLGGFDNLKRTDSDINTGVRGGSFGKGSDYLKTAESGAIVAATAATAGAAAGAGLGTTAVVGTGLTTAKLGGAALQGNYGGAADAAVTAATGDSTLGEIAGGLGAALSDPARAPASAAGGVAASGPGVPASPLFGFNSWNPATIQSNLLPIALISVAAFAAAVLIFKKKGR